MNIKDRKTYCGTQKYTRKQSTLKLKNRNGKLKTGWKYTCDILKYNMKILFFPHVIQEFFW